MKPQSLLCPHIYGERWDNDEDDDNDKLKRLKLMPDGHRPYNQSKAWGVVN